MASPRRRRQDRAPRAPRAPRSLQDERELDRVGGVAARAHGRVVVDELVDEVPERDALRLGRVQQEEADAAAVDLLDEFFRDREVRRALHVRRLGERCDALAQRQAQVLGAVDERIQEHRPERVVEAPIVRRLERVRVVVRHRRVRHVRRHRAVEFLDLGDLARRRREELVRPHEGPDRAGLERLEQLDVRRPLVVTRRGAPQRRRRRPPARRGAVATPAARGRRRRRRRSCRRCRVATAEEAAETPKSRRPRGGSRPAAQRPPSAAQE
mmetsp:Transcript_11153/g.45197  ORF Transcript_11153/g.45197 Transcript_11153/m.45197 type:complete len:269 (+) Transcript_11153:362-1168(+)